MINEFKANVIEFYDQNCLEHTISRVKFISSYFFKNKNINSLYIFNLLEL